MIKRLALVTVLTAAPFAGVFAPTAAHADGCNGLALHVSVNINGNQQGTDQCVPLALPPLP
jgi:hypothetical protein